MLRVEYCERRGAQLSDHLDYFVWLKSYPYIYIYYLSECSRSQVKLQKNVFGVQNEVSSEK